MLAAMAADTLMTSLCWEETRETCDPRRSSSLCVSVTSHPMCPINLKLPKFAIGAGWMDTRRPSPDGLGERRIEWRLMFGFSGCWDGVANGSETSQALKATDMSSPSSSSSSSSS
eukprot:PhM_4_TR18456/c0_g1_i2/m.17633